MKEAFNNLSYSEISTIMIILMAIITALFGLILFLVFQNEKKAKKFRKEMKPGNFVTVVAIDSRIKGIIHQIENDNEISVIVKVPKNRIYPLE